MSSVTIPKKKFHALSSFSEEVFLLEVEIFDKHASFSDKNDLLRIDDQYNRKKTGYESSVNLVYENLEQYNYFTLFENACTTIHGTTIRATKDLDFVANTPSNYTLLLEDVLYTNGKYLKEGSLLTDADFKPIPVVEGHRFLTIQNNYSPEDSKIVYSVDQLSCVLKSIRENNKSIIMTCGCYDIIHVGHLHNLKSSKSLGDVLIVCMSNDAQIKKLKGDARPINTYIDRINIFKTLPYIDYLVLYDESDIEKEETLGQLMKLIRPDVWTKGNDYTVDRIIDKHPYLKKIVLIDNLEGKSTTNIINKIIQS
jgi:rfaE bifunctional protein nucleotidyltransferase chain/domain